MIKQEFIGASGILLPGAITIPKGEEIAISQDWLIFPDAITGKGKVWTIDGLLTHCIKKDNEVWVDSNVENPFTEPIIYKGKNTYGWLVGEIPEDITNELDYIDRKLVRNIILSNYVTDIPDKAFYECYNLQNIIISNSVLRIGNIAFGYCTSLKTLTIPDSVIEMGGGVLYSCLSLQHIKLPNTLTHLSTYLDIDGLESLGFFSDCYRLYDIILPQTLENIGRSAFHNCSSLTSITIPEGVTSIGVSVFSGCSSLTSINIPESITSIEDYTFSDCSSLATITIPNSITSIGDDAFRLCYSLTFVTIGNSVTSIGGSAFYSCHNLQSIDIPNSVLNIGPDAFAECASIKSITLGSSVTSIDDYAFSNNYNVLRIRSYAEIPPIILYSTFNNIYREITLEVPNVDLYRNAPYWEEFYNIQTINPYQLNVSSNNEELGTVEIVEHNTNRSVIQALPKSGYAFKQWSDGDTNIWRELNITEDTTLVAEFEKEYYNTINYFKIINCTPTSVTLEFEISCNEERDYLDDVYIIITSDTLYTGYNPLRIFGVLELTINNLNPSTAYNLTLYAVNNTGTHTTYPLDFTTNSFKNAFSVSENKYVAFSPGNLQYHPANNEWRFAESQWDYIGDANTNISSTYNGWLDLFGWGTGNAPTKTSENYSDYQTFVDWGTNQIGADAPNTWRTLTADELNYILYNRANASELFGVAQVNGVNGVILLPDDWVCPPDITFKSGCSGEAYSLFQTFSSDLWAIMEGSGAIFMIEPPYFRANTELTNGGNYWSASASDEYLSCVFYISATSVGTALHLNYIGNSVRLVMDLN